MQQKNKLITLSVLICSGVSIVLLVTGMQKKIPFDNTSVQQVMDHWVTRMETLLIRTADAMPENRYSFVPTNGNFHSVRSFAEQVKHLSATQYQLGAAILGENPPSGIQNETAPDSVKNKAEIMRYLKNSFLYLHKAVAMITEKNMIEPIRNPLLPDNGTRLGITEEVIAHTYNHYGQMVEYLRMNNIVPPASQKIR